MADLSGIPSTSRWPLLVVVLVASLMTNACGSKSQTPQTATGRLEAICHQNMHALLAILQRLNSPEAIVVRRAIDESLKVDDATSRSVRRLPPSLNTDAVLGDLDRSRAHLLSIELSLRVGNYAHAHLRVPRDTLLSFVKADRGCGVVKLREPPDILVIK